MRMTHPTWTLTIATQMAVALLVGACSGVPAAQTETPAPDPKQPLIDEYTRNVATWQKAGISRYGFTYTPLCFCPPGTHMIVGDSGIIRIDGVAIDSSTPASDGVPAGVPGLFDLVRRAIDGDSVTVRYDPRTGVPVEMDSDPVANAIDDEFTFKITDWTLEPPDDHLLGRLTAARRAWERQKVSSYAWSTTITCECVYDGKRFDITVRDGDSTVRSGGKRIANDELEGVPLTITGFFDRAAAWVTKPGSSATFDPELAYPIRVSVGPDPVLPGQAETIEVVRSASRDSSRDDQLRRQEVDIRLVDD